MSEKQLKKICFVTLVSYIIGAFLFYFIAGDQLRFSQSVKELAVSPETQIALTDDTVLRQPVVLDGDRVQSIELPISAGVYQGQMHAVLLDGQVAVADTTVDVADLVGTNTVTLQFVDFVLNADADYTLQISAAGMPAQGAVLYYGNDYSLGKGSIPQQITVDNALWVNDTMLDGMLCYKAVTVHQHWFGQYYWGIALAGLVLLVVHALRTMRAFANHVETATIQFIRLTYRYEFLVTQLISKSFKNKYKRSALGVLWSLLNPIMTMSVQYVVFSLLFKSNIPNFALYLIIGIVCFNFFNEAVTVASQSIIFNASLIRKVYMPRVIYPLSSILSSMVNLVVALLPLLLVMLITWTPLRPSALLVVFVLLCLFLCSLGFGLLLSALMVFFRDVQYLWGVVSMIWMYLTPIFYPVTILPGWMMNLMQLNPMYHFITFMRTILMNGISPAPGLYAACLISAVVPFVIGLVTFKKLEDKFIFYL